MLLLDRLILVIAMIASVASAGCVSRTVNESALQLVEVTSDRAPWPDLRPAFEQRESLLIGIERSLEWIDAQDDSTSLVEGVTVGQVRASLEVMRDLLQTSPDAGAFSDAVRLRFVRYTWTEQGKPVEALFTGYFAPEYRGSLTRTDEYTHPLYAPPRDWSPGTTWHTRREIVEEHLLTGRELVWLADALDAYLIEVNGSGRVSLPDGRAVNVGHMGTNNRPYTSLGRLLIDHDLATEDEMSMQTIRRLHEKQPATVESFMLKNDRMVFFELLDDSAWPRSALGLQLVSGVSAALDQQSHPPAALLLIELEADGASPLRTELRLSHDTGGAIVGPGRADLFIGIGPAAGEAAGRLVRTGRISLLLLAEPARAPPQN